MNNPPGEDSIVGCVGVDSSMGIKVEENSQLMFSMEFDVLEDVDKEGKQFTAEGTPYLKYETSINPESVSMDIDNANANLDIKEATIGGDNIGDSVVFGPLNEISTVSTAFKLDAEPISSTTHPVNSSASMQIQWSYGNTIPKEKDAWMDVCYTKFNSKCVSSYFNVNERLNELPPDCDLKRKMEFMKKKIEIEPGTVYRFRVAAFNSCGRGPWSEVSQFKTALPGFPGAPGSIKISKIKEGALIQWEPPHDGYGPIEEYSVFLALKNSPKSLPGAPGRTFARVYCGRYSECTVSYDNLSQGYVDKDGCSKPAIIFRIAAKNGSGYGPATQVRWLQETAFPKFPKIAM